MENTSGRVPVNLSQRARPETFHQDVPLPTMIEDGGNLGMLHTLDESRGTIVCFLTFLLRDNPFNLILANQGRRQRQEEEDRPEEGLNRRNQRQRLDSQPPAVLDLTHSDSESFTVPPSREAGDAIDLAKQWSKNLRRQVKKNGIPGVILTTASRGTHINTAEAAYFLLHHVDRLLHSNATPLQGAPFQPSDDFSLEGGDQLLALFRAAKEIHM
jgi:hypothetical protein